MFTNFLSFHYNFLTKVIFNYAVFTTSQFINLPKMDLQKPRLYILAPDFPGAVILLFDV